MANMSVSLGHDNKSTVINHIEGVLGSIMTDCNNTVLHTPINASNALSLTSAILQNLDAQQILTASSLKCLQSPTEVLMFCKEVFGQVRKTDESEVVVGVVAGPTMFPIPSVTSAAKFLRPYWCLSDFRHQPALHVPEYCTLERLPTARGATPQCLTQTDWEYKAKGACHAKSSQHILFSAYPLNVCGYGKGYTDTLRIFAGIQFVCCKPLVGTGHANRYHTDIELTSAFDLLAKPIIRSQIKESAVKTATNSADNKRMAFVQQFQRLMRQTDERRRHLEAKFSIDAFRLANDPNVFGEERISFVNETLTDAHNALKKLWESDREAWIELENVEHASLQADFDPEDKASLQEFEYTLQEPRLQIDRVQTALSRLLDAVGLSVDESVRHLSAIIEHVPWYLLASAPSGSNSALQFDSSKNLTVVGSIEQDLIDHVDVAGNAIRKLNLLMGRLLRENKTVEYSEQLHAAYDNLSSKLVEAKTVVLKAKTEAQHEADAISHNFLLSKQPRKVEELNSNWHLFVKAIKAAQSAAWQNESHRGKWLEDIRLLDDLLVQLQRKQTTQQEVIDAERRAAHVYGLVVVTSVIFVCLLGALAFIGCYMYLHLRSRCTYHHPPQTISSVSPGRIRSEGVNLGIGGFAGEIARRFKSSYHNLRPGAKRYRTLQQSPVHCKGFAPYQPMHSHIIRHAQTAKFPAHRGPIKTRLDFSSPAIDQYTRNLVIRGYENPTYRLTEE